MSATIYPIHKGINRPISFKGLKAQYLTMAAAAIVGDLLLFVLLYIAGLNAWVDTILIFGLGAAVLAAALHLSKKYGEYGLMKRSARKKIPRYIKVSSRKIFLQLKK